MSALVWRVFATTVVAAMALSAAGPAFAGLPSCDRQVKTVSNREATVAATYAVLNLQVQTANTTASGAIDAAELIADDVFASLALLNATQQQVTGLYVYGTVASESFDAYLTMSSAVGVSALTAAIGAAVDAGATLSYVFFALSPPAAAAVEKAALAAAVEAADQQATDDLIAMQLVRRATCGLVTTVSVGPVIEPSQLQQLQQQQLPRQQRGQQQLSTPKRALVFFTSQVTASAMATLTVSFEEA